ncbi:hypothetical protein [Legionella maioricensis]|uniref:Novel toxin 11 domain-containing protein n=1 Tax=Legionella maioricensis TaxID=2896528 RepID=A0A9X2CXI1_9GAMM|nr:hypothetical protein [Legionella maioricensis]MCL9682618.1 hypothetical protein [Legionella maioricensis]MCL9687335.1 hypothetical protein [Legionella maioricensis]
MPDKIFDIFKCTIDEDQHNVATQWAKTFIHNPIDLATGMTQLVMACVARGDFKTRSYLSGSSELQDPSDQLTIADYLSHASRIIIDYNSLSEENAQELLSFFPEASGTNKVFARSATHNVNQVNDKVVEGKGVVIGLLGQLPSIVKKPLDFGINIAMGGAGQDNFYGKKISDNGFSGHFYYHRNTEHKLLLAGLEQSAPAASALGLLMGSETYPEEVQQGHDQFGQGHSLTGASDTYTAAGSLYFSSPVYQAKLLLEKGVFPPDKYGAMQVTITDDNWPLIKEYLKELSIAVESGNQQEVVGQLLEKPSTAKNTKGEYKSYVALDFSAYLKQVYKVFVADSELEEQEKLGFELLQSELLILIKKLQEGNVKEYNKFDSLISQMMSTERLPEEYKQALARISELFKLQLSIDPQLKHTQLSRRYQFGDITLGALGKINQMLNGAQITEEGEKEYEFGDITWGLLNRINNNKKYQFGDLSWGALVKINEMVNGKKEEEYQFGDIVSGIWGRWSQSATQTTSEKKEETQITIEITSEKKDETATSTGYGFVSYARNLIWRTNTTTPETPKSDNKEDKVTPSSDIGM